MSDSPEGLTKSDYEVLAAFRYALRLFLRFSEQEAYAAGATPQQYQALLATAGYPGRSRITIGELAERLQIRHHSAVGLVDRLEAQGWMRRTPDETDRRQVRIEVTADGTRILERLAAVHRRQLGRLAPVLQSVVALGEQSPGDGGG
jgi:DNA-binding MarR family transcriptional regulator